MLKCRKNHNFESDVGNADVALLSIAKCAFIFGNMRVLMSDKKYRILTFVVLVVAELAAPCLMFNLLWRWFGILPSITLRKILLIALIVAVVVMLFVGWRRHGFRFPDAGVFRKILSYQASLMFSLFIMVWFLVQITWFMDSMYALLFNYSPDNLCESLAGVIISLLVMVALLFIYPYHRKEMGLAARESIYSMFSVQFNGNIAFRNFDLVLKPFFMKVEASDGIASQYLTGIKKVMFFISDKFKYKVDKGTFCKGKNTDDISNSSHVQEYECLFEEFSRAVGGGDCEGLNQEEVQVVREKWNAVAGVASSNDAKPEASSCVDFGEAREAERGYYAFICLMKLLMRLYVKHLSGADDSQKAALGQMIDGLEIRFSGFAVNYNEFASTFREVNTELDKDEGENGTEKTLLYISPGTSISGGVMTALAMKENRLILYADQSRFGLRAINPSEKEVMKSIKDE